jgi:hypothetical protein
MSNSMQWATKHAIANILFICFKESQGIPSGENHTLVNFNLFVAYLWKVCISSEVFSANYFYGWFRKIEDGRLKAKLILSYNCHVPFLLSLLQLKYFCNLW